MVDAADSDSETTLAELVLSRGLTVQLSVVGTLGLGVALAAFSALYHAGTGQMVSFRFAPAGVGWWNTALDLLVVLSLGTAVIVPHEWLHGLAIRHYGGQPRYGVGLAHFIFPYAYATTDHRFTRDQFLVVLLTPAVVLTLVGLPLMIVLEWGWLVVPLAANAGGAVADVWMSLTLLGYPSHVVVQDHRSGVRIIGRAGDTPRDASVGIAVWNALVGAAVATVGLLVLVGLGGPFVTSVLGMESLTVGRPGTITFLFAFVNTPEEVSVAVGFGVLVVGAMVGLAYSFVRTYLRHPGPADDHER